MLLGSEGKFAQLGFGMEAVAGQKATPFYYARVKNFKMKPERPLTASKNTNTRGQANKGQNLVVNLPLSFQMDPGVDDVARIQGHLRGFASIAALGGGAFAWTLRDFIKNVDSMANPYDTLSLEGDRDDLVAQLDLGVVLTKSKMKIADRQLIDLSYEGMAQHYTEHNDFVLTTTGGTFTGRLLLRGNRVKDASFNANALKCKATTGGALGTALVKFTEGAVAYGANTRATTAGVWLPVLLADDTHASGDPLEPMEYMFLAGGTLSINDEFTSLCARAKGSPSYSSRNPLQAVGMTVTIGGVSYVINGADIEHTRPREAYRGGGSKFPVGFLNDGIEQWKITLTRKYVDRVAWDLVKSGAPAVLDVDINGDLIAASTFRERWRRFFPQVQVSNAGTDPDKEGSLDEQIVLEPSYDGTNALCTETIHCTLATLV